jgi:Uma2 family endonuclease
MALPAVTLDHTPTLADLEALPENMKGEIIDGVLYAMTRPRSHHQNISGLVYSDLVNPFQRGRGGPGGWWILVEPGIELPNAPEVAPDIAGWRRERMPELPKDRSIQLAPDWVCEVLSPSTRSYHFLIKRPFYARCQVRYLWEVDPQAQILTVSKLENGRWVDFGAFSTEDDARLEPFEVVPSSIQSWWE